MCPAVLFILANSYLHNLPGHPNEQVSPPHPAARRRFHRQWTTDVLYWTAWPHNKYHLHPKNCHWTTSPLKVTLKKNLLTASSKQIVNNLQKTVMFGLAFFLVSLFAKTGGFFFFLCQLRPHKQHTTLGTAINWQNKPMHTSPVDGQAEGTPRRMTVPLLYVHTGSDVTAVHSRQILELYR